MPADRPLLARVVPERILLRLLGSVDQPDAASLAALDASAWQRIGQMARSHRLGPQLHSLHRHNSGVPDDLRREWSEAYRAAALTSLAQRADLQLCCDLLERHGYRPLALKGSFLAQHAWPDPALRPMRDIDLLLPQNQVLEAYRLLLTHGYVQPQASKLALEDHVRLEQHMPVLQMPRGSWLELHMRVSELEGRLEYATPAGDEAGMLARAITIGAQHYPCPNDMLAHVITHAVYGHRFDCGPLLLGDVRYLVARHEIDWPAFWQAANAGKWQAGAALVFALVRDSHGEAAVLRHADEPAVEPEMLELARDLIVQDWERKTYPRFAAAILTGGLGYVWRRITGKVAGGTEAGVTIDRAREGGRLGWAWQRARDMAEQLADPKVRQQARQLARYRRWLEG